MELSGRAAGVGHVAAHLGEHLGQAKHVGVDVEADDGRLGLGTHAARSWLADVS